MKKVLIFTYYWPPSGGAGVLRWLRFTRYLPEMGWEPTVITTRDGDYPFLDADLEADVGPGVRVIRTWTPTFGKIYRHLTGGREHLPYGDFRTAKDDSPLKKLLFNLRINFVVPDARVIWVPSAIWAGTMELEKRRYDAIITTGPPHSVHLTGLFLSRLFNIPWFADFRDPWTHISYMSLRNPSKTSLTLQEAIENKVVTTADGCMVFSDYFTRQWKGKNRITLMNGFREEEFEGTSYARNEVFRIKYIGKLTEGRELEPMLDATDRFAAKNRERVEFSLIGTFDAPQQSLIDRYPHLSLRFVGFSTHREALRETVDSEAVVLLINRYKDDKGIIPLKIFEYIGSKTIVIGQGPIDGESARLLEEYRAGKMFDYDDTHGVVGYLESLCNAWKTGTTLRGQGDRRSLCTSEQTRVLVNFIKKTLLANKAGKQKKSLR